MVRIAIALLWSFFLFICTCTISFKRLVKDRTVAFHVDKHPDWRQLFNLPLEDIHSFHMKWYLFQKLGHFSGFAILAAILTNLGRNRNGLFLAVGYAALTEILQLYFSRDGRIFDVLIDGSGIMFAWVLLDGYRKQANRRPGRKEHK